MDLVKIGNFLSELRKEHGFTQEQLGEKLGVTNKTVSRWETGTYLPPADILIMLSELYSLTINEILSGQRLSAVEYQEEAEKKLVEVLKKNENSAFTLKDRIEYFTKKWKKEHTFEVILGIILCGILIVCGFVFDNGLQFLGIAGGVIWSVVLRNRMMAYVEGKVYRINSQKDPTAR